MVDIQQQLETVFPRNKGGRPRGPNYGKWGFYKDGTAKRAPRGHPRGRRSKFPTRTNLSIAMDISRRELLSKLSHVRSKEFSKQVSMSDIVNEALDLYLNNINHETAH